jgi:V8-like Glu-specific endopeptidase
MFPTKNDDLFRFEGGEATASVSAPIFDVGEGGTAALIDPSQDQMVIPMSVQGVLNDWFGNPLPEGTSQHMAEAQAMVNSWAYPYSTVVHIFAHYNDGQQPGHGSGVMVGKNDVLTAGHVVWDPARGGSPYAIEVIPAHNPTNGHMPYGKAMGKATIHPEYTTRGLPVSVAMGDNNPNSMLGSEIDYALIGLDRPLGNKTNWMKFDTNFNGYGELTQTGYPHINGRDTGMTNFTAVAVESTTDNFLDISRFETWGGNSGGPLWRWGADGYAYVAGVVSTGTMQNKVHTGGGYGAFDASDLFVNYFYGLMNANDSQIIYAA